MDPPSTQPSRTFRPTLPPLHSLCLPGMNTHENGTLPKVLESIDSCDSQTSTRASFTTYRRPRQTSMSSKASSSSTRSSPSRATSPSNSDTEVLTGQPRRASASPCVPPYLPASKFTLTCSTFEDADALVLVLPPINNNLDGTPARRKTLLLVGPSMERVCRSRHKLGKEYRLHPYRMVLRPARSSSTSSSISSASSSVDEA